MSHYFTLWSRWSIKKKTKKIEADKILQPGPNYSWHIDSHGKLKLFGFPLHGCIDGSWRRLILLEVSTSNKKLENIDKFALDAVRQLRSISKTLKADSSTEHVSFCRFIFYCEIQLSTIIQLSRFRCVNSFSIVPSMLQQWMETWDIIGCGQDFLNDLIELEQFSSAFSVLVDCLRFGFIGLFHKELKKLLKNEKNMQS